VVAERAVPVIGNGDILTHYEARWRRTQSACASVMIGRAALIKPWIFGEIARDEQWLPSARERVGIYLRLVMFMKEHFGDDARGQKKAMYFLPWHLGFLCRYRPLPEATFGAAARLHPLLQSRLDAELAATPLERLLGDGRPATHEAIARALWEGGDESDVLARLEELALRSIPETCIHTEVATAQG
jgi:tRNA-dihydrouridine synthase 3